MTDHPLDQFTARPGQTLRNHIEGVAAAAEAIVDRADQTPYDDDWAVVAETLAWTHDIGKLTGYFQEYIETNDRNRAPYRELTYHGFVGALLTAQALASRGCASETVAAGFYAVAKHHSVLQNVPTDFRSRYFQENNTAVDQRYETIGKQLANIDATAAAGAERCLREATDSALGWEAVPVENPALLRQSVKAIEPNGNDTEFYGCVLRAWSTLITADKFDASNLTTPETADELTVSALPESSALTKRLQKLSDTQLPDGSLTNKYLDEPDRELPDESASTTQRLDALRSRANGRATSALREGYADGQRLFRLTLPTGFGKTLTGLRAALALAEQLDSRVVYALPYTSIIDQVDSEVQKTFGLDPTAPAYTKHHHLADTRTIPEEDDDADRVSSGRDTMHAEAWRSGLVLTTFTQLFESVAGPRNVQSMKLPALQDSVIIVDEPQAVSLQWWELIGRLADHLATEYDATILFMTATQPRILDRINTVPTPTRLIDTHEDCLDLIEASPRVEFELHDSIQDQLGNRGSPPLALDAAANELRAATTAGTDTLAIVNTVGSATALTERFDTGDVVHLAAALIEYQRSTEGSFDAGNYLDHLATEHDDEEPSLLVATLTTRLRPADRAAVLEALRRVLDEEKSTPFDDTPTIAVSTQLIEAGVDISFDRLYRDLAPLPAIVQAAGRCNREFSETSSTVTIWQLDSPADDDYIPSQLIYESGSLLRPTRAALDSLRDEAGDVLPEAVVIDRGVEMYYDFLHCQRRTGERHDDLVGAFDSARGDQLRNASLIEQEYPTRDIILLMSDQEYQKYCQYVQHRKVGNWANARRQFRELKHCLVSIPAGKENWETEMDVLLPGEIEEAYDLVGGRGPIGYPTDSEI
jgi:CRISPR-associated endonuclease Cas3-HD